MFSEIPTSLPDTPLLTAIDQGRSVQELDSDELVLSLIHI